VVNPWVQKGMIDTLTTLAPICQTTDYQYVLVVNPKVPVNSAAELVALAKRDPEKLTYSSAAWQRQPPVGRAVRRGRRHCGHPRGPTGLPIFGRFNDLGLRSHPIFGVAPGRRIPAREGATRSRSMPPTHRPIRAMKNAPTSTCSRCGETVLNPPMLVLKHQMSHIERRHVR
jgi:hypothetical protein